MNLRRLALATGVVALVASGLAMVAPTVFPLDPGRSLVTGIGLIALLESARLARTRRQAGLDEAETPDPEVAFETPAPGHDLQTTVRQFLTTGLDYYPRNRIRTGLQTAAVEVLNQYAGYSQEAAEEAVRTGNWTGNDRAAAFLGDDVEARQPVHQRVAAAVRGEGGFAGGVRHAIDAIGAVAGFEYDGPADAVEAEGLPTEEFSTTAEDSRDGDHVIRRHRYATGHWRGVSAVALIAVGAGLVFEEAAVLLAGVVGIGYAAYGQTALVPPGEMDIERSIKPTDPEPEEDVEVTVTVRNASGQFLPDVRVVDGVPEALGVIEGSPRLGTALRAGGTDTFSYTVRARRGEHHFRPTEVVARDLAGAHEEVRSVHVPATVRCVPPLFALTEPVPLREQALQYVGQVETNVAGEGLEFYATREYRQGDTLSRIDWNRHARTGELTTVQFRQERAAEVMVVVDARPTTYVAPQPDPPHVVDRSVEAAGRIFTRLSEDGDRVGLAALGPEPCWQETGNGVDHRNTVRKLLGSHPALGPLPVDRRMVVFRWEHQFRKRLSSGTQVILISPLTDEYVARVARRIDEYGHPVTVLAPDPTAGGTASERLAQVARGLNISKLRHGDIPVVEWPWDDAVDAAIARHQEVR